MSTVAERLKAAAPLFQKYDSPISITTRMAQFVVESQAGVSDLFKKSNNGFGIKASAPWAGDVYPHLSPEVDGARVSEFRKYASLEESIKDHAGFFTSTDFRKSDEAYGLAIKADDYKNEAKNLGPKFPGDKSSYAGDPLYAQKLVKAVQNYKLEQYDIKKESAKMPTVLLIAGHGLNTANGYFDPGARGFVPKGEHRWYTEDIFPAMHKYLPKDADVIFHTAYNVYSRGNIVALAKSYGSDTIVIECHFDSGGTAYSKPGGHVIIYKDFNPDALDLRLRDAIKGTVGLHPHYKDGISKRDNLQNVNLAARGGINYRLIEWGMSSDKSNGTYMVNNVDAIAKAFVKAIFNELNTDAPKPKPDAPNKPANNDFDLPAYQTPTQAFKPLKVGDSATIREGQTYWYIPDGKGRKPSKNFAGDTDTITKAMDVNVGYSKRAYLLKDKVSWVLEQDLVEPRAEWSSEQKDQQEQLDYVYINGVKRAIGDVIK